MDENRKEALAQKASIMFLDMLDKEIDAGDFKFSEMLTVINLTVHVLLFSFAHATKTDLAKVYKTFMVNQREFMMEGFAPPGARGLMRRIISALKQGMPAEEVADKYVNCATPELRDKLIDHLRRISGTWMIMDSMENYG